jgi:hypothetical protein
MANIKLDLADMIEWYGLHDSCENGNEPSGSIRYWDVVEYLAVQVADSREGLSSI